MSQKNIKYVNILNGLELWLVDYDKGVAIYQKPNPYKTYQEIEFVDHVETIYEYLEEQGYEIDRYVDSQNGYKIHFHKRTFIYLRN